MKQRTRKLLALRLQQYGNLHRDYINGIEVKNCSGQMTIHLIFLGQYAHPHFRAILQYSLLINQNQVPIYLQSFCRLISKFYLSNYNIACKFSILDKLSCSTSGLPKWAQSCRTRVFCVNFGVNKQELKILIRNEFQIRFLLRIFGKL